MRTIEPVGDLFPVPPAHPGSAPGGSLRRGKAGSFYDFLQDAALAYRRCPTPCRGRIAPRLPDKRKNGRSGLFC